MINRMGHQHLGVQLNTLNWLIACATTTSVTTSLSRSLRQLRILKALWRSCRSWLPLMTNLQRTHRLLLIMMVVSMLSAFRRRTEESFISFVPSSSSSTLSWFPSASPPLGAWRTLPNLIWVSAQSAVARLQLSRISILPIFWLFLHSWPPLSTSSAWLASPWWLATRCNGATRTAGIKFAPVSWS